MASIDFISTNCNHNYIGPLTKERAEQMLLEEKISSDKNGDKNYIRINQSGDKELHIEVHGFGWIGERIVRINYKDNNTYGRCY